MNSIEAEQFDLLRMSHGVRDQGLAVLTDRDLPFRLPGENHSLAELCEQQGRIENAYAASFRDFELHLDSALPEGEDFPGADGLGAWFTRRDRELEEALRSLREDDIANRLIDRGGGWQVPVLIQFHIYRESLLIFFGKVDIYLRALGRERSGEWFAWVG